MTKEILLLKRFFFQFCTVVKKKLIFKLGKTSTHQMKCQGQLESEKLFFPKELMNFTGKHSLLNLLYGTPTEIKNQFKQATLNSTQKLTLSDRKDFENGMIQRQKFISQRCEEMSEGIFKENYEPEVYCPFNNLMYCPVHKASSTMHTGLK